MISRYYHYIFLSISFAMKQSVIYGTKILYFTLPVIHGKTNQTIWSDSIKNFYCQGKSQMNEAIFSFYTFRHVHNISLTFFCFRALKKLRHIKQKNLVIIFSQQSTGTFPNLTCLCCCQKAFCMILNNI